MGRSRFPGKPLKFQNRKRVSVLSGAVYHETASESQPPAGGAANDFAGDKEVPTYLKILAAIYALCRIYL